jgi:taurine---2-oxoglutarate transaminase
MNRKPYFITWSKQSEQSHLIPLRAVDGPYLLTEDNAVLADLSSVSYQACFGQQHPHLTQKIIEQAKTFCVASPKTEFELKERATLRLLDYLNLGLPGRIFYTLSGAESIENALKMARQLTQKKIFLARQNSYHGATLGALSVTGDWRNPAHFTVDEWTVRIPEPKDDPELKQTRLIIEKIGPENICGFCLETITGGNGVIIPSEKWWRGIQSLCDEFDLKLILDEVINGFHRTGEPLAWHHYSFLKPDYICLAKAITGGMIPFGALWVNEQEAWHYDEERVLCQGLTSYAHPLGLAVMEGVLDLLSDPEFLEHLKELTLTFQSGLKQLDALKNVNEVRTIGLLAAIDTNQIVPKESIHKASLTLVNQGKRLILAPAFTFELDNLKSHLEQLSGVLESL